jgi:eukaryotic-like serine/threonine-protein kinase
MALAPFEGKRVVSQPVRWREIEQVVAAALDMPAEERDRYVDSVCGNDIALSTEVRALIRAYEDAGDFLDPITYHGKWTAIDAEGDALTGKLAGSYRLVRLLGRGGMGVVYLGLRDDDQFDKQVAVKLMNPALYSPSVMRRFRDERQILASLDHPNIARLLDAGLTSEGIPFIVMEYVEGAPVHRYCANARLSVRDRLKLFVKICDAVHFAHKNLIVHRDLKPSNILVSAEGVPKLLDFGIAKMLSASGPDTALTAPFTQALTPDYASPEQVRGRNLTTASDVYSLGVLLYELLTGQRPYVLSGKPLDEILHAISEQDAPRLSEVVAQKDPKLARRLAGDLDHIVAKALRKEVSERYGSAEQLAADIGRHLDGLPVIARRGSWRYLAGKYVRRYKVAFIATAAALLLACAGVAAIARQARIAESERAVAQRRFNEVRELARSVIFELHDGIAPLAGSLPVRKQLVTRALEFLNKLAAEASNDRGLTLELVQAFSRIGEVQGGFTVASFGEPKSALASFTKAHDLLLPIYHANPSDAEAGTLMAQVYYRLGNVSVGFRGLQKGLDYLIRSEECYQSVLRAHPDNEKAMLGLAGSYYGHAVTLGQMDREPLSEYWQKSGELYRKLLARGSREPNVEKYYARMLTFYASRLELGGRIPEALEALDRSQAINEKRVAANPADRDAATDLSFSLAGRADVLTKRGRDEEALASYRASLAILRQLSDASPQDVYLRNSLAVRHASIGDSLLKLARNHDARASFYQAIEIYEDLASRNPAVSFSRANFALTLVKTGKLEKQQGRHSAACGYFQRSASVFEAVKKQGGVRKPDQPFAKEAEKAAASCVAAR